MKLVNIGCGHNYHTDWVNLDLYKSEFVKYYNIKNKLPFLDNSVDVIYHSHVLEHLNKLEAAKFIKDCYKVLKPGGVMRVVIPDLEQICIEYLSNLEKGFSTNDQKVILNYKWNKIELLDQVVRQKIGGEMLDTIKSGEFNEDYVLYRNGEEFENMLASIKNKTVNPGIKDRVIDFIKADNFFSKFIIKFIKKANPQKSGEAHKWMYDRLDLKLLLQGVGFKDFKIVKYNESKILNWDLYALDKSHKGEYSRKPDSLFVEVTK